MRSSDLRCDSRRSRCGGKCVGALNDSNEIVYDALQACVWFFRCEKERREAEWELSAASVTYDCIRMSYTCRKFMAANVCKHETVLFYNTLTIGGSPHVFITFSFLFFSHTPLVIVVVSKFAQCSVYSLSASPNLKNGFERFPIDTRFRDKRQRDYVSCYSVVKELETCSVSHFLPLLLTREMRNDYMEKFPFHCHWRRRENCWRWPLIATLRWRTGYAVQRARAGERFRFFNLIRKNDGNVN